MNNRLCSLFKHKESGSLTVEAVLILPLIFISWLTIINFLNIYFAHLCIQQALNNTAKRLSEYTYLIERANVLDSVSTVYSLDEDTLEKGQGIRDNGEKAYNKGKEVWDNSKSMYATLQDTGNNLRAVKDNADELMDGIACWRTSGLSCSLDGITSRGHKLM